MTDKSKTPAAEELTSDDLEKVHGGGYTEVEWTYVKGEKPRSKETMGWNIEQGSAWKVEEGEGLKDAKDSDTKG